MAASPAPTRPPDLAEWAKSRLYKIAHPAIFGAVMHGREHLEPRHRHRHGRQHDAAARSHR
jgi:hypothetical protein